MFSMSRRLAVSLAGSALAIVLALDAVGITLGLSRGTSVANVYQVHLIDAVNEAAFASLAVLGLVVAWYRPRNPIWTLGTLTALCSAVSNAAAEYAFLKLRLHHPEPWFGVAVSLATWSWVPQTFTAPLVMVIYPTGRVLSRRWRWLVAVIVATAAVSTLATALQPGPIGPGAPISNPLGVMQLNGVTKFVSGLIFFATPVFGFAGLVAVVVRYRRASGDERQQIKWLAYAAGLYALQVLLTNAYYAFGVHGLDVVTTTVNIVSVVAFPVAVGIGILRYRLFDIDVVINRTLVYGTLAALITAVYVGIVIGLGSVVGSRSQSNLLLAILATAVIAVGFQPLRQRVQRLANRLVFGSRATPYEVLSEFSRQVADTYAGEDVLARMARVLCEGTAAESAVVWLGERAAAEYPPRSANQGEPGQERHIDVWDHGERLGALTVRKRRGETLSPLEEKLLEDLAHQAGLVLRNVGLTQQLLGRLEELRASRQRLVRVQDEERRRLERDLHDGAQQHLVALKLQLGLARDADPGRVPELLGELEAEADTALKTMRELARGIYPPLLQDRGLAEALQAQARRATLPVTVESDDVGRYPQEVEAAVYFCVLEALQNLQKHAHADRASVRLSAQDGLLSFEVRDDGRGFDPAQAGAGSGLTNLRDRLEALGGDLKVASAPGQGTTVAGALPVQRSSASNSSNRSNPSRTPDSIPEATIASRSASD